MSRGSRVGRHELPRVEHGHDARRQEELKQPLPSSLASLKNESSLPRLPSHRWADSASEVFVEKYKKEVQSDQRACCVVGRFTIFVPVPRSIARLSRVLALVESVRRGT